MAKKTCQVNPGLETLLRPITELREDPKNARQHADRNIDGIVASLKAYGQQKPVVTDQDGVVIAGNGTLRAATRLSWTHIAAVTFDKDDPSHQRGYAIADNRTGETSKWDYTVLEEQLRAINDDLPALLDATGFNPGDLKGIFDWSPEDPGFLDDIASPTPPSGSPHPPSSGGDPSKVSGVLPRAPELYPEHQPLVFPTTKEERAAITAVLRDKQARDGHDTLTQALVSILEEYRAGGAE